MAARRALLLLLLAPLLLHGAAAQKPADVDVPEVPEEGAAVCRITADGGGVPLTASSLLQRAALECVPGASGDLVTLDAAPVLKRSLGGGGGAPPPGVVWGTCTRAGGACLVSICGAGARLVVRDSALTGINATGVAADTADAADATATDAPEPLAGLLCAYDGAQLVLRRVRATHNALLNSTVVVAAAALSAFDSEFAFNDAGRNAAGGGIGASDASALRVTNCSFTNHTVALQGGAIALLANTSADVRRSTFMFNSATKAGGAISISGSHASVSDCRVEGNAGAESGGAFTVYSNGTLRVADTLARRNVGGQWGGVVDMWGLSYVSLRRSRFVGNSAQLGGAVFGSFSFMPGLLQLVRLTYGVLDIEACLFASNMALEQGGALLCSGFTCNLVDNVFVNNSAFMGGAVEARKGGTLTLVNATIVDNRATSDGGGVLGLTIPADTDSFTLRVTDSVIERNSAAQRGGGLALIGGNTTLRNVRVYNNSAVQGGGIFYAPQTCPLRKAEATVQSLLSLRLAFQPQCGSTLEVSGGVVSRNRASSAGGGIYWAASYETRAAQAGGLLKAAVVTSNNTAYFGADIAYPPSRLSFVLSPAGGGGGGGGEGSPQGAVVVSREGRSAGLLPPFFVSVGVPVEGVRVEAKIAAGPSSPPPALLGELRTTNSSGVAEFFPFKLQGAPGEYALRLSTPDWPDVAPLTFNVTLRACVDGEVLTEGGDACQVCPVNTFGPDEAHNGTCAPCPAGATCQGGAAITPRPGFWHSTAASTQVHRCPLFEACTGARGALYSCDARTGLCVGAGAVDAQCADGYESTLCARCAPSHGSLGGFRCAACLPRGVVAGLYVLALVVLLALLAWLTHYTMADNRASGPPRLRPSELIKILVRYGQYVVILSSVPIQWPATLRLPFTVVAWVYASGGAQALALDCLSPRKPGGVGEVGAARGVPLAMGRLLIYLLTPLALLVVLVALYALAWAVWTAFGRPRWLLLRRRSSLRLMAPPDEVPASVLRMRAAMNVENESLAGSDYEGDGSSHSGGGGAGSGGSPDASHRGGGAGTRAGGVTNPVHGAVRYAASLSLPHSVSAAFAATPAAPAAPDAAAGAAAGACAGVAGAVVPPAAGATAVAATAAVPPAAAAAGPSMLSSRGGGAGSSHFFGGSVISALHLSMGGPSFASTTLSSRTLHPALSGGGGGALSLGRFLLDRLPVMVLVTVFTFYPALVRVALAPFSCYAADAPDATGAAAAVGSFWTLDMAQLCWYGWHLRWALGLGVPATAVFCAGVPLGIFALLRANRGHLNRRAFKHRFGFLYRYYRPRSYWWEAVSSAQTMVLVAITVFGAGSGVYYELLLLTAAFIAVLLSIVALRPMALRPLHTAQLGANGVLCLTSFVMLSFLQLDRDTGDAYREAMGALLLTANLLWVLWALFAIVVSAASNHGALMRTRLGRWLVSRGAPLLGVRDRAPHGAIVGAVGGAAGGVGVSAFGGVGAAAAAPAPAAGDVAAPADDAHAGADVDGEDVVDKDVDADVAAALPPPRAAKDGSIGSDAHGGGGGARLRHPRGGGGGSNKDAAAVQQQQLHVTAADTSHHSSGAGSSLAANSAAAIKDADSAV